MRRLLVAPAVLILLVTASPASAATRQVSSGNFYFEDVSTGSRMQVVVKTGDQVVVTVTEAPAIFLGAHTVDVDELNIHSGDLVLGQTFTTPPLNKPGNFLLYCDNHRNEGHTTRLIVQAPAPKTTPKPTDATTPAATQDGTTAAGQEAVPLTADPIPLPALTAPPLTAAQPTLAPVGVGQADEVQLQAAGVDPNSLEGLIGRDVGGNQPWTRALWFLLISAVAVIAIAAGAVVRGARLAGAAAASAAPRRRGTAASSSGPRRSSGRSPRSSRPKASASARKSRGRRR